MNSQPQVKLRVWQAAFLQKYIQHEVANFLLVATPGAGKTFASLAAMLWLKQNNFVDRIIVVCPSSHLRTQWIEVATKLNIHLNKLEPDEDGYVHLNADYGYSQSQMNFVFNSM